MRSKENSKARAGEDLVIANARLLMNGKLVKRHIVIQDGIISDITSSLQKYNKHDQIDAKGLVALPGLIDSHVHFREPGYSHKETWLTGSRAAVAGGVTTVLEMPNTSPATLTPLDIKDKRSLCKKSIVDFGLHIGASLARPLELLNEELLSEGAAVKFYFDPNNGDPWIPAFGEGRARVIGMLRAVAMQDMLAVVHAKGNSVSASLELARWAHCPTVVAHTPGRKELAHIIEARAIRRLPVHCEVSPTHLFLTQKDEQKLGQVSLVDPPLGTHHDQKVLWHAIKQKHVDIIATDHAPHTLEEKKVDYKPALGVPGLETMLPLLLDARHRKMLALQDIQRLCCENPALIYKIADKGFLAPGYDADIVLVDLKAERKVQNKKLFTKCGWSPFHGKKLRGWSVMTFVRGLPVFDNGKIVAPSKGGTGKEIQYAR